MKKIACGRKNWLFFGNNTGGEVAEVYLTLIASCRRNNVEPLRYLADMIELF
jgi:transposase